MLVIRIQFPACACDDLRIDMTIWNALYKQILMIIELHPVAIPLDVSLENYCPMKKLLRPPEKNVVFFPPLRRKDFEFIIFITFIEFVEFIELM